MADRLDITDLESAARRAVDVPDGTTYLTVTAGGSVVLGDESHGAVLRIVPTRSGKRLEPITAGGHVVVNGEELFCKDLRAGDSFELGNYRLVFKSDPPAPEAVPTASGVRSASVRRASDASTGLSDETAARRRTAPAASRVPAVTATVIAIVVIIVTLRFCARTDWPRTPQHYVDLARTQQTGGRLEEALATIDFALREATGDTRVAAEQLRREISGQLVAASEAAAVRAAREGFETVVAFRDRYLGAKRTRPPARELLRLCAEWRSRHGGSIGAAADGKALLAEADRLAAEFGALAEPTTADTAADVIFAAQSHLRFLVREYKAAIARLDAFLAEHPGDAEVTREREAMLTSGRQWFVDKVGLAVRLADRGDVDGARDQLRALERHSLLPAWEDVITPLRERLAR